jgi:hypothetical protein
LLLAGCQSTVSNVWWTSRDETAVNNVLSAWSDSTSTRQYVEDGVEGLADSAGLLAQDSISTTGDSLIKVKHLTGFGLFEADMTLVDSLHFGVSVDSISDQTFPGDSFCHVIATDSAANSFADLAFDQYYVVTYRPSLKTDSGASYTLDTVRLVKSSLQLQKDVPLKSARQLFLKKTGSAYDLRRMSGFGVYLPSTTNAPAVRWISLARGGETDTYRLNVEGNYKGIYSLCNVDSLPTVKVGESLGVYVDVDAPAQAGDQYYFIDRADGQRSLLSEGTAMTAPGSVAFSQTGIQQLVIEVIPQSNLLYPASPFTATIWSLPLRVTN